MYRVSSARRFVEAGRWQSKLLEGVFHVHMMQACLVTPPPAKSTVGQSDESKMLRIFEVGVTNILLKGNQALPETPSRPQDKKNERPLRAAESPVATSYPPPN